MSKFKPVWQKVLSENSINRTIDKKKSPQGAQSLMNIIIHFGDPHNHLFGNNIDFFQDFTKEELKRILQECKGIVVPEDDTIYAYGFRKKPVSILIDNVFEKCDILIRRFLWLKGGNQREYINIYPSCVIKYCPFILDSLEYIEVNNISQGKDPLDGIEDPENILESSEPILRWIKKIAKKIELTDTIAHLASHYTKLFGTLPETFQLSSRQSLLQECLHMLHQFIRKMGITLTQYQSLSYGNYTYPL